jgi:hypothetical protein
MLMIPTIDRRGKRSDTTLRALATRDQLLREAAATFIPGWSSLSAANKLHGAIQRYREGAWRRERVAETVPPRHHGRIEAHLWSILRTRDHTPSIRSIRRILAIRGQ